MKVEFKGIVRGAFSNYQLASEMFGERTPCFYQFVGSSVEQVLSELCIEEWIFVLKVNGKRVKNPIDYFKRKGLNLANFMRDSEIEKGA